MLTICYKKHLNSPKNHSFHVFHKISWHIPWYLPIADLRLIYKYSKIFHDNIDRFWGHTCLRDSSCQIQKWHRNISRCTTRKCSRLMFVFAVSETYIRWRYNWPRLLTAIMTVLETAKKATEKLQNPLIKSPLGD